MLQETYLVLSGILLCMMGVMTYIAYQKYQRTLLLDYYRNMAIRFVGVSAVFMLFKRSINQQTQSTVDTAIKAYDRSEKFAKLVTAAVPIIMGVAQTARPAPAGDVTKPVAPKECAPAGDMIKPQVVAVANTTQI